MKNMDFPSESYDSGIARIQEIAIAFFKKYRR